MNHGLITIGGYNDKDKCLSCVEMLNKNSDKKEWKYLSFINNKRYGGTSTSIQNKLFLELIVRGK